MKLQRLIEIAEQLLYLLDVRNLTRACYATDIFITLLRSLAFLLKVRGVNQTIFMTIIPFTNLIILPGYLQLFIS